MPTPRTRRALLAAGSAAVVGLAGCIGRGPTGGGDGTSPAPEGTTPGPTPTRTLAPATDVPGEQVRPEGDPYAIERTVEDEDVEYLESEHAVRYVAAREVIRGELTREPVYKTIPFEEWATYECDVVAVSGVYEALDRRLDYATDGISVGVHFGEDARSVRITHRTVLGPDGSVVFEPSAPFEEVVAATPAEVSATVTLAGNSHSCTERIHLFRLTVRDERAGQEE